MDSPLLQQLSWLIVRDDANPNNSSGQGDQDQSCVSGNDYDGKLGVRISPIFVILIGGFFGAWFPTFAARRRGISIPTAAFFIAKYFGSGVIIATAFIHLLAPANENLSNSCLPAIYQAYPWCEGIALMTIFVLFFVELMTIRYAKFGHSHDLDIEQARQGVPEQGSTGNTNIQRRTSHLVGEDHHGHSREHTDKDAAITNSEPSDAKNMESYSAQLTAIFILEFGVIFHSVFIGLTLAVSGSEFVSLYIVLVFHQTFEGLGLGSRLSGVSWPKSKRWTPYYLAMGYAISTPLAIAIGLGVRKTYPPDSTTTLIVNGVFDSISAGILIYTGLVELMAHEFMFSPYMSKAPIREVLTAFFFMCLGAGIMALLGKWA